MKVRIIDLPIKPLVRLANDFADSIGIEKKAAVAGQMAKGGQVSLGDYEFDEHGWAYSYGKFKAKNRSFGFMISVDPNEKASVSWDEPYMQNATWDKKIIDEVRKDMPISNKMAKGGETKFINLKTLKGQSEVEKYLQKGWSVKYQGDKFAILQKGGKKMVKGGATFDDKVKAISKNLKGRKVPKKLQKDYGKTYDTKQERDDAARRIAGAMRAEEMGTRKK
jgi:hypothetical protein